MASWWLGHPLSKAPFSDFEGERGWQMGGEVDLDEFSCLQIPGTQKNGEF